MEDRHIRVYEAPGMKRDVPRILLQGVWLKNLGYNIGDHIKISHQDNRLIIELEDRSAI